MLWHLFDMYRVLTNCKTWPTALFLKWFGCHGSWLWLCLFQLIQLYAKKNFYSTAWSQYIWHYSLLCLSIIVSMLLPLSSSLVVSNSFYFCLFPIHNFYCAASYGKPAAETCSLCLSPVAIPFIGFPASLLSTQLTIIWVI